MIFRESSVGRDAQGAGQGVLGEVARVQKLFAQDFPPDGWAAVYWFSSSSVGGGQPEQVTDLGPDDAAALQTDASALIF